MNKIINVKGTGLMLKTWNGQPVVTFKDIDKVHQRPEGTAKRNFNENKDKFILNEDYFIISQKDLETKNISKSSNSLKYENRTSDNLNISDVNTRGTTFFTESGYLMLVKSFTDDLAWEVQRKLVNMYFKTKEVFALTKQQYNEICNKYDELSNIVNNHLADYAEIKQLVLSNAPSVSPYEKDAKEKIKEYKEGLLVEWMRNMDEDLLLDQICQGRDIDQKYYKEKYITETQDRYPTKLRYLLHYSVPRKEIFDFLDSCIRSHKEALYDD